MNKTKVILTLISIIFFQTTLVFSQSPFEGKIKFKIKTDNDISYIDYYIKEKNLRIEMGENAEAVFIKQDDKSLILMPEEEMYMDLNQSIFKNIPGMNNPQEEQESEEEFDIEKYKTGKVMSILGYECHQWLFKDETEDDEAEAWVTNELGNFMLMQGPMGGGYSPGWGSSVKNSGFFPMLVITRDEGGDETSRFEATEINEEKLNDRLFKVPSNYSEMKIPGMDSFMK
ncbi:MAG: DUF4412 domain-containing protein [Melioribacteraceae bacterium]|nr:DUF4412 domain-containing protein [Melioribacteraceae bacterium]